MEIQLFKKCIITINKTIKFIFKVVVITFFISCSNTKSNELSRFQCLKVISFDNKKDTRDTVIINDLQHIKKIENLVFDTLEEDKEMLKRPNPAFVLIFNRNKKNETKKVSIWDKNLYYNSKIYISKIDLEKKLQSTMPSETTQTDN